MINKISIIGGPGSGKSTLADYLEKILDIPVVHIDTLYENKNWKYENRQEVNNKVLNILKEQHRYIIDGTYTETLKKRLEQCDLIIYLDFSTIKLLKGILKRRIQNKNMDKDDLGWNEKNSLHFVKYVLTFNLKKRKKIYSMIKENKKCVIIKNRKELILLKRILEVCANDIEETFC